MTSRKRGLSKEEIQRLLDQDDDSDSGSEFDISSSSSSDTSDSEPDSDDDHNDAAAAYQGSTDQSSFTQLETDTCVRNRLPFTGVPGRRVPVSDTDDPQEYFNAFITDEMINNIVTETNRRAQQLQQSTALKKRSHHG